MRKRFEQLKLYCKLSVEIWGKVDHMKSTVRKSRAKTPFLASENKGCGWSPDLSSFASSRSITVQY